MNNSSRPQGPHSINPTPSSSSHASSSAPQRVRSLSKKSSAANLRGFLGRLKSKTSTNSLDFGCSGHFEEEDTFKDDHLVSAVPLSPLVSGAMSHSGSSTSFRSLRSGTPGQESITQAAHAAPNSLSFPSPSLYSPPLYALPGSPSQATPAPPFTSDDQREAERKAEEQAAEAAILIYMTRNSMTARKASLPTNSLASPLEPDPTVTLPAHAKTHTRSASTSSTSTRSSLASRPRTNDSLSSCQSGAPSSATSLASSACSSPSYRRPTFKNGVPEAHAPVAAAPGPRTYAFI